MPEKKKPIVITDDDDDFIADGFNADDYYTNRDIILDPAVLSNLCVDASSFPKDRDIAVIGCLKEALEAYEERLLASATIGFCDIVAYLLLSAFIAGVPVQALSHFEMEASALCRKSREGGEKK